MAPNLISTPQPPVVFEKDSLINGEGVKVEKKPKLKHKIVWRNAILFLLLHASAFYGVYLAITSAKMFTNLFGKLSILSLLIFICKILLFYLFIFFIIARLCIVCVKWIRYNCRCS